MMKLDEACLLADRIVHSIEHLCDPGKIKVVGSIRRKQPEVHDIDIVLIPQEWMWNTITQVLKNYMAARVVKAGQELVRLAVPCETMSHTDWFLEEGLVQVDLYRARPETWGVLLLIRTGNTQHNIMLCSTAQHMGLMLSAKSGVIKEGKVIASRTEEEIFKALNMDFIEPEKREV